jgi:ATP-binding cassette subfamily B protein
MAEALWYDSPTVVLDAVFSIIYILVMVVYSWVLTIVALATVPLFALINLLVSPLIRRQLQEKAERNAETHSYLVEAMAGMQTIKAQNLEMRSRWQWQERYARYISAGFKTISTQTTASSVSSFLNKFSNLLVLWVGAYLVLHQQLTFIPCGVKLELCCKIPYYLTVRCGKTSL